MEFSTLSTCWKKCIFTIENSKNAVSRISNFLPAEKPILSDLWIVTYLAHFCELLTLPYSWNMSAFQLTKALKLFAYLESRFQQQWHFSLRGENFESLPSFSCTYCTFNACESGRLSWVSSGTLCWLNSALFVLLWSWHRIKALHWEDGFWFD